MSTQQAVKELLRGGLCSLPVQERPVWLTRVLLGSDTTCSVSYLIASGRLERTYWWTGRWASASALVQAAEVLSVLSQLWPACGHRALAPKTPLYPCWWVLVDHVGKQRWQRHHAEMGSGPRWAHCSVASSAGSTATMAVLVQSPNGHLNGWPSYPFDQEECYARATAATRSQSLTVIVSQIDMMGIMGMIQVLAARAHPIVEVYQTNSNWTMPELCAGETVSVTLEVQVGGHSHVPSLCWNLWYILLHRLFVSRAGLGSSRGAQRTTTFRSAGLNLLCKQGRPGVISDSQGPDWWAEHYLCVLNQYVFELPSPHRLGAAFCLMSICKLSKWRAGLGSS